MLDKVLYTFFRLATDAEDPSECNSSDDVDNDERCDAMVCEANY